MISAEPAAVWYLFTLKVFCGSKKETFGSIDLLPVPNFWWVARFEITAPLFISLPVAANVKIVTNGNAPPWYFRRCKTKSQASPSNLVAAATTFAQSIVEPPPTAKITSTFSLRQISAPRRTVSTRGFGSTPANSKTSLPFAFSCSITLSYKPIFLILPPPYTIKTFLPYWFNTSGNSAKRSLPKRISVVTWKSKFSI